MRAFGVVCQDSRTVGLAPGPIALAFAPFISNLHIFRDGPRASQAPVKRAVLWRGSSLEDVRRFPEPARREAGRQLNFIQHGGEPSDWKAMATVGAGVIEIRIHASGAHRVLVVTKFASAVFVLHAFEKKSRKTARRDLDLARRRYRDLMRERERL